MGRAKKSSFSWTWLGIQLLALYALTNFTVQLWKKPAEALALAKLFKAKSLEQTWESYGNYFVDAGTDQLPAEFLAALAQQESAGNPWATPPWTMRFRPTFFGVYAPMSSAVGLYQFLDETFERVRGGCVVVPVGDAEPANCARFGTLRSRLSPQASTQFAAWYLNREVDAVRREAGLKKLSADKAQVLAAITHLCGRGRAAVFAKSGFSWSRLGGCGAHSPQSYVTKVMGYARSFAVFKNRDSRRVAAAARP